MRRIGLFKKIAVSCVVIAVALTAGTQILDGITRNSFIGRWDDTGARYLDRATLRALATFAMVRGINGVISVFQGTDIALSPAGVGVRVAVGEILDPVNDLVERFSWVMLVATTSLGIQKVMMHIGRWIGIGILLPLAMAVLLIGIWLPPRSGLNPAALGIRLLALALVVRFCIPAVAYTSDRLYQLFLEPDYIEATGGLDIIQEKIKRTVPFNASQDPPADRDGQSGGWREMIAAGSNLVNLKETLDTLKTEISGYAEHTVNLIIVFVLQTVLIPLLFLWLVVKLLRFLCLGKFAGRLESVLFRLIGVTPIEEPPTA